MYSLPTTLICALFPLTLAYVIVVQRALDVRVVVRQGVQYAMARRGLELLQLILTALFVWLASRSILKTSLDPTLAVAMVVAAGVLTGYLVSAGVKRAGRWVDHRFFRDAYDTEQLLTSLSDEVRTIVATRPLFETVVQRLSSALHVPRIAALVGETESFRPAYALGYAGPDLAFRSDSVILRLLREHRSPLPVYFDDEESWIYRNEISLEERRLLQELNPQLLLPLAARDKLVGFLSLGAKRSEEAYSPSDLRLLRLVAAQTGLALENSLLAEAFANQAVQRERITRELEIAREVQERLFPQVLPAVAGLEYAGTCRPAREVGGDYYDFLPMARGQLGIAIGDISGKGIPAALLMASLQASLRAHTSIGPGDLGGLLANISRLIYDTTPSNRYATFFYAQYDPAMRRLSYSNGGHNSPILISPSGQERRLEAGGPPVGLFPVARYAEASVDLQPGDILVFFTDGVSEAQNLADEEWGEGALVETVRGCVHLAAREIIDCVLQAADQFAAGAPQHDDMTLVIVKVMA